MTYPMPVAATKRARRTADQRPLRSASGALLRRTDRACRPGRATASGAAAARCASSAVGASSCDRIRGERWGARALRAARSRRSLADRNGSAGRFCSSLFDDRTRARARRRCVPVSSTRHRIADVLERDGHGRLAGIRQIAGEHLIEDDADAVEIGTLVSSCPCACSGEM